MIHCLAFSAIMGLQTTASPKRWDEVQEIAANLQHFIHLKCFSYLPTKESIAINLIAERMIESDHLTHCEETYHQQRHRDQHPQEDLIRQIK